MLALSGPGAQGHAGQALAVLAQTGVSIDHPISIRGRRFRVSDLVTAEQAAVGMGRDSTFQLIGLAHYLDVDTQWQRADGESWSIERMLEAELARGVSNGACGGSHRLMSLLAAVQAKLRSGSTLDGVFARARWMLLEYQREAYRRQNPDGSFSTGWFERPGLRGDLDRRLETTGHVLEWLSQASDDDALQDPRLTRAVAYLSGLLLDQPERGWASGPLAHALNGLSTWQRRSSVRGPSEPR